jgi:hypothetical protein
MVERFNGRISELCQQTRFKSAAELEQTLKDYLLAYNHFIPQRAIGHRSPIDPLKSWYDRYPEMFVRQVCNHAERDRPYLRTISFSWPSFTGRINMAYPLVNIVNSTNYLASGTVNYASAFCSDDSYTVTPGVRWTAENRGVCLLTGISAVVKTPSGDVTATPYSSSGTSYSQFAIIQTGFASFEVTRRVTGAEDVAPAEHVEPTSAQK